MLKALRLKFVLIIMILGGTILITVLGGSYASTWQTQRDITNEALERSLHGEIPNLPRITMGAGAAGTTDVATEDALGRYRANVLILSVDLDANGVVIATNDAPMVLDEETLAYVVETAILSDKEGDWDEGIHLAWRRLQRTNGTWRVVIADTSAADLSLQTLAVKDTLIVFAAMAALLVISVGLSGWALNPVEQAWKQQRQFVSDASHELKTPLAVISANTQILEADTTIPNEAQRWIKSTSDEAAHMKNLVEELLELARTDESSAGATNVMKKETIDFSSMVENASLEFDAIAFERGTQIEEDIEPNIMLTGDSEWLTRLCKILIDNACKYAKAGTTITVRLTRKGKRCEFLVNNHGNVIDPKDLPHVFDRFYRTDKARSHNEETGGGFGLGLAIAKGIATSHGGTISVDSNATDGTTFCVVLPIS